MEARTMISQRLELVRSDKRRNKVTITRGVGKGI